MCSRPSIPSPICRKAPYFLILVTSPSTIAPGGKRFSMWSQGSWPSWRRLSEMREVSDYPGEIERVPQAERQPVYAEVSAAPQE